MKNFLKSKLFLWGAVLALLFLTVSIGQKLYKKYLIEREISRLEEDIASLQAGNKNILELIDYFKTPEFRERQARSLLSLQKPGEFAVALPPRDDADPAGGREAGTAREKVSNLKLWWDYFFFGK